MAEAPKWQRARIIRVERPEDKVAVDNIVWVTGRPQACPEHGHLCDHNRTVLETNIGVFFTADFLELLPEFAEDVPLIPWEQFLAECGATA